MEDKRVTGLSIALVVAIFGMQMFLLYRLYEANMDLLQRELNLAINEVYEIDLGMRLSKTPGNTHTGFKFAGTVKPEGVDTTTIVKMDMTGVNRDLDKEGAVTKLNKAIEEYISDKNPPDLCTLDSIASEILRKNNINLTFFTRIINTKTGGVNKTSWESSTYPTRTCVSKNIPLNVAETEALQLVLIAPLSHFFPQMVLMLVLSIILIVILIYSFYTHRRALSRQRQIVQLKNDLFSELSHEFKKPLSVLQQVLSAFSNEKVIKTDDRRERYLKIGESEILKMTEQTEMILSLARDDEGVFELYCTSFNLEQMVADLSDRFVATAVKPLDIDIVNNMDNPEVFADKDHLEHVISNLVTNAIKYSKTFVKIQIVLSKTNNTVTIAVKDNGIGIAQDDQKAIFDKYSRVGNVTVAKGHGIGLNYVKRIIDKHGGNIEVISELDKGSEFVIQLPQKKVKDTTTDNPPAEAPASSEN